MPDKTAKRHAGAAVERRAEAFLGRAGLLPVTRNYRSPFGEIDLVMRDGQTVVFVEVRSRAHSRFASPAETVDARKQERLRATAEHYLQRDHEASKQPCRFDIVAVTTSMKGDRVEWLRNAF